VNLSRLLRACTDIDFGNYFYFFGIWGLFKYWSENMLLEDLFVTGGFISEKRHSLLIIESFSVEQSELFSVFLYVLVHLVFRHSQSHAQISFSLGREFSVQGSAR